MNQEHYKLTAMVYEGAFLERPCPPAVDNFDLEKSSAIEFEEVSTILSVKKKDLKQKGLSNKPNAAQPVETEDIVPSGMVEQCHALRNERI